MYNSYLAAFENPKEAVKRVCMKLDMYWNESIYNSMKNTATGSSRIKEYIRRSNLMQHAGKTYDDTLDEEYRLKQDEETKDDMKVRAEIADEIRADVEEKFRDELRIELREEIKNELEEESLSVSNEENVELGERKRKRLSDFWGTGFEDSFYLELEQRYNNWISELNRQPDITEQAIYKQICILELTINKDLVAGKSVDKNINALNSLLGSMNLKPAQKKEDTTSDFFKQPFGVGIGVYEDTAPIPEPDEDFKDKDSIIRYITVWFLGHLCKMLHIRNSYCKMYEEEMERLRVERPEISDDEDDEEAFDDIFGDSATTS